MRSFLVPFRWCRHFFTFGLLAPAIFLGAPVDFDLPAGSVAESLMAFSHQARAEVLFSFDELKQVKSSEVLGRLEPEEALSRLLSGSGYTARRNRKGKFVVSHAPKATGALDGKLTSPNGTPLKGIRVTLVELRRTVSTDTIGEFRFSALKPGTYELSANGDGFRPLKLTGIRVDPDRTRILETISLPAADEATRLDPYVVEAQSERWRPFDRSQSEITPQTAGGNLDLRRTEDGALPYTIFDRDRITRSGVVDLNEFLQREVLEGDANTAQPEQGGGSANVFTGSSFSLRGYSADETVILINGRRLPEVVTSSETPAAPDVNFIPLSLIERVEVLPASASSLYSGNAVGGVINVILRSDAIEKATEVTTTYTNALRGFDAPQSTVSILHGQSFLNGALRVRLNASFTEVTPPTEAELGYHQSRVQQNIVVGQPIYRATPNIRSPDLSPITALGTSPITSVSPGADGNGGLSAFAGRAGLTTLALFDAPAGEAVSLNSVDYPYGRRQKRAAWFGSAVYDVFPWLQIGLDGIRSDTTINRGLDVFAADLKLDASTPGNPFKQDVLISLNDTASALGQGYNEARIGFTSGVLGAIVKMPADWRLNFDAQYARNVVEYRGLADANIGAWQRIVDEGKYSPLRDTQLYGAPAAFYDEVLVYYGGRNQFVKIGDYNVLDFAVRATNENLPIPTGRAVLNGGLDYRRSQLENYTEVRRFGNGSLEQPEVPVLGRTLERISAFGEVQAPILAPSWRPSWLRTAEIDVAARYVQADTSQESNLAPTFGLKLDFAGGFSARASITTSSRFPNPKLSRRVTAPGGGGNGGIDQVLITDPRRGGETYDITTSEVIDPGLLAEEAVTQIAGIVYTHGEARRLRVSLDFYDTQKTNESIYLYAETALLHEELWPDRITRFPLAPGDPNSVGRVKSVLTGRINAASRHSQNWNLAASYVWPEIFGGTIDLHGRWVYFQKYERQLLPDSPVVDQLKSPDDTALSLLKHRATMGVGWANTVYGFGVDGQYLHSRLLPEAERVGQGSDHISPYWQFDAYVQSELSRWIPWKITRFGLRGQLRVNNVLGQDFPRYNFHSSGAGVQPYGDWRNRTYSLSVTATF